MALADSTIKSVTRNTVDKPAQLHFSMQVNKVDPASPAQAAGIKPGDLLLYVNTTPANSVDYAELAIVTDDVRYTFYKPAEGEQLVVEMKSVPLGAELIKSNETVFYEYSKDINSAHHTNLYPIWNRGEWQELQRITDKAFIPIVMWLSYLGNSAEYSPEYLFNGAALYDGGQRKKGMARIQRFEKTLPNMHTHEQQAVVKYYYAQEALHANNKELAIELLREAFGMSQYDRIADQIQKLTGERPVVPHRWLHQPFPLNYQLQRVIYGDGWVKLSDTLNAMQNDQLLVVCVLGGYRVNRFYNAFMQRYTGYRKWFADKIYGLHVITADPGQENHPDYFEHEARCIKQGNDVVILHEIDWEICNTLEIPGSPSFYVLDKNGVVRHDGELYHSDIWSLIS